jgi:hypothetical protein
MNRLTANKKQKQYSINNEKRIQKSNNILIDLFKVYCFLENNLKGRDLTKGQKKALKYFGFAEYSNETIKENIVQFINKYAVVIAKKYRYDPDSDQSYTEVIITIFGTAYCTDWYNNGYTIIYHAGYEGYFSQYQYWLGDILDKKIKN